MNFWKWFYPGLGLKRWLFLLAFSIFLLALGMLLSIEVLGLQELKQLFKEVALLQGGTITLLLLGIGLFLLLLSIRRVFSTFFEALFPGYPKNKIKTFQEHRLLKLGPKIAAIGGGTGLSMLLRGLKPFSSNLTAIVTVADDGGSSGKLREELGILPPGDIRNCLIALADKEDLMERTLRHRFCSPGQLYGHSLGNLFLAGMTEINDGNFNLAVKEMSRLLAIRGRVLPVTLENVTLVAELWDGTRVEGESRISESLSPIKEIGLRPESAEALPETLEAIRDAELIVIGPGSLYTSILPVLLAGGIREALRESKACKVYVCNVMTQPGETIGYSAADHLEVLLRNGLAGTIDYIVLNNRMIESPVLREKYAAEGASEVEPDYKRIEELGVEAKALPLLEEKNSVRHDSALLARELLLLCRRRKGRWRR